MKEKIALVFILMLSLTYAAGYFIVNPARVELSTWVITLTTTVLVAILMLKWVRDISNEMSHLEKKAEESLNNAFQRQLHIDDLYLAMDYRCHSDVEETANRDAVEYLKGIIEQHNVLDAECDALARALWNMGLFSSETTIPSFRMILKEPNAMTQLQASSTERRVSARRLVTLQEEISMMLEGMADLTHRLRNAKTVSQGGVSIKVGEDPSEKFDKWIGDIRRRLLVWIVRLSVRSLDKMPQALAGLGPTVARDVADTPAIRELLTGSDAPPWGHALLAKLVPPAFPDVNVSSTLLNEEDD